MERWNELIAGYVLGNLTQEEQIELSIVLEKNPQLKLEIARLRKTATISRASNSRMPTFDWSPDQLPAGAEGWADTAHISSLVSGSSASTVSVSTQDSSPSIENRETLSTELDLFARLRQAGLSVESAVQRLGFLGWLIVLLLVSAGLDNWRMRRLLAIAQERIFQLELSTTYSPTSTD
ncbi:MAG: hypothetical protein AAFO84_06200 [Cyanobacteria bacterium J06598_1]